MWPRRSYATPSAVSTLCKATLNNSGLVTPPCGTTAGVS